MQVVATVVNIVPIRVALVNRVESLIELTRRLSLGHHLHVIIVLNLSVSAKFSCKERLAGVVKARG